MSRRSHDPRTLYIAVCDHCHYPRLKREYPMQRAQYWCDVCRATRGHSLHIPPSRIIIGGDYAKFIQTLRTHWQYRRQGIKPLV